jgi:hypothetical protein
MHQAAELKVHVRADTLPVKAGEQGRRGRAIKTFTVKKDPDFQKTFLCSLKLARLIKLIEMTSLGTNVKDTKPTRHFTCACIQQERPIIPMNDLR